MIHIDTKKYAYLKGGIKIVGITVVDNYSGFASIYICPEGTKTAEHTVEALTLFRQNFPEWQEARTLYSDNGTEFVNSKVLTWCESNRLRFKQTKPGHPWSNGKAEVTQRLIKHKVILPLLIEKVYENLEQLSKDVQNKMLWYNYTRPHSGRINKGLTPGQVAISTSGLEAEERESVLSNMREGMRWKNRAQRQRSLRE